MITATLARISGAVILSATIVMLVPSAVAADATPEGLWKTIDDETGEAKSHIRIAIKDGTLSGTIEKILPPGDPKAVCVACEGELKNQPIVGMKILTGMKKGSDGYKDGQITDPNNGKSYNALVWLDPEDANKLNVKGYIGVSLFGRSQTWLRAQ
jgi:uncharacterized protein (DUF2147 family)